MNPRNITKLLDEGRLMRRGWAHVREDGQQLLCSYTALFNDPAARPDSCPAEVMPHWMACLIPWLSDSGTIERWPDHMRQLATVAERFPAGIRPAQWSAKLLAITAISLRSSASAAKDEDIQHAVVCMADALSRGDLWGAYKHSDRASRPYRDRNYPYTSTGLGLPTAAGRWCDPIEWCDWWAGMCGWWAWQVVTRQQGHGRPRSQALLGCLGCTPAAVGDSAVSKAKIDVDALGFLPDVAALQAIGDRAREETCDKMIDDILKELAR